MFDRWLTGVLRQHPFRGKARLLNALCPHAGYRRIRLFGATMRLDLSDFIQREIYLGLFEPHETRLVKTYLHPGMTVVDVGANIGYYVVLAASRVGPSGRVLAFEPSPWACQRLRHTVAENGLDATVSVHPHAVGDRAGTATLFMPGRVGNHTPSILGGEADAEPIDVPLTTLDDALRTHGIDRVDLLKIDVEGFEPNVLAGARQALRSRSIKAILCELNRGWLGRNGTTVEALYDDIIAYGFQPTSELTPVATQTILFRL